jgi:ketosteroid isomerase-like protein
MPDRAALLAANEAFYRAFARADMAAMLDIWTTGPLASCTHPGWPPLTDRDEIAESWRRIFEGQSAIAVAIAGAMAFAHGECGYVLCYERIGDSVMAATNIFRREGGRWRLVHHQAGPVAQMPEPRGDGPRRVH